MLKLLTAAIPLALALPAPALARAQPEAAPASDPTVPLARALFERGLAAYEAEDYAAAVKHWTSAHDLMASEPSLLKPRRVLAFDLGQAQMRAYDADGDASRLSAARPLLEGYVAWVDRPEHTMSAEEREDRQRAIELLARIDVLQEPASPPSPRSLPAPTPDAPRVDVPERPVRNGTGLLVTGSLSIAAGVGFAVGAGLFNAQGRRAEEDYERAEEQLAADPTDPQALVARDEAEFRGIQGNRGFIATATLSALSLGAGISMVIVGSVLRRRSRRVAVAPTAGGAQLHLRF